MKKEMQESVLLIGYSEEKFKNILSSIIHESFNTFVKDKLKTSKDEEEFLTIRASAKFLNKSVRTLYNWANAGLLNRYYIEDSPYFKKSDLINLPKIKNLENEKE